jgi:hypothetical protein
MPCLRRVSYSVFAAAREPRPCRAFAYLGDAVEDTASEELDNLAAELFARPTVASAARSGAAKLLYEPGAKP